MACELSPWLVRKPHPSIALITTLSEFLRRCSSKREAEMGSCSLALFRVALRQCLGAEVGMSMVEGHCLSEPKFFYSWLQEIYLVLDV
jgi:hypothetical protein